MSAASPIERGARALCELDGNPPGATMDAKPLWQNYLPEVRAVLTAIREPDAAMQAAAAVIGGFHGYYGDDPLSRQDAADVWRVMVDAALAEETQ
ncbi:hypothetical protein HRJ34_00300 [Rhizorhabdus wittichii]|uniref:Uncharacterized protein n=1 Tax=Rhizorhabdus wittichii TaxID=160791 RepID=A0A975HE32_9SPHN|nr:hypothetical protein [Rhizorhabdus wittichii]QTH22020.1 hypothetical protein HRJ34_00300 [Rhizorhabdus wittichii]